MDPIAIFCKSYRKDLFRVLRLATSFQRFNHDQLPFYISIPQADHALFAHHIDSEHIKLLCDEDIIRCDPAIDLKTYLSLPGYVQQQVVKAEFWRAGYCENYLCLDSDAIFIRPFFKHDFLHLSGTPYTIIDEAQELFLMALAKGREKIHRQYLEASLTLAKEFGRQGPHYSFGPMPIWSGRVWQSLFLNHINAKYRSILDLIQAYPHEVMLYGESLLKFRPIDIIPRQPLFRTYHYAWQERLDRRAKVTTSSLEKIYLGIVRQSNWEWQMDFPRAPMSPFKRILHAWKLWSNRI